MVMPMSFEVGAGGGAFCVVLGLVELLQPAITQKRTGGKSDRKTRMVAPQGSGSTGRTGWPVRGAR
jgi:hypothetical protein